MTRRILLGFLVFTVVVLAMLVIPLGLANAHHQRVDAAGQLERDAFIIASAAEEHMEVLDPPAVRRVVQESAPRYDASITVVGPDGRVVATDDPSVLVGSMLGSPEVRQALDGTVGSDRRPAANGTRSLYVAVPVASAGINRGAVVVEDATAPTDRRIARYWGTLGALAVASAAVAAGIGVVIARSIARPLAKVEDTAERLGAGELSARAPITGPAEVRTLASALNDMAERLATLLDAQQAFVADASHQLRTPLTALRLRLENIETDQADETERDAAAALREVDRLSRIVDGLLALARPDRNVASPDAPIDLVPLIAEARATWLPIGEDQQVTLLEGPTSTPLLAVASVDRVGQVLDNLVANAIDASPVGGTVTIWGSRVDGHIALHVTDQGPGLDEVDRARAFDRFWRSPAQAGVQTLGGSGLGLAIVQKLAHADGATAALKPAIGGGIDAVVTYRRG